VQFLPADLIIVHGHSFVDLLIEDISKSKYSHVAGIVNDAQIIEAEGFKKISYAPLSKYLNQNCDLFTCNILTSQQRNDIVKYVTNQLDCRYDYLLLLWEMVRFEFHCQFPYVEHKKFICSTLWADAYRSVGVDLTPTLRYPSPGELAQSKLLRKVCTLSTPN